jgi:small subunit ribosomal protein S3
MIERKFVSQRMKDFMIQEYVLANLPKSGISHTRMQLTPLGEKIVVFSSRPGLVVGKSGKNIQKLTHDLKEKFGLENPQIEISEIEDPRIEPQIVGDRMASSLEQFGSKNFKGTIHKAVEDVLHAGALGVEIVLSGKVPSARAKSWRVLAGYMKKCGDVAITQVRKAHSTALLKTGIIGIKVSIMPPGIVLPDRIKVMNAGELREINKPEIKEVKEEKREDKPKKRRSPPKKKEHKPEVKENES